MLKNSKVNTYTTIVILMVLLTSCSKNNSTTKLHTDQAIQATIIAHGVSATLTAQAPNNSRPLPTNTPEPIAPASLTPMLIPTGTPTPMDTPIPIPTSTSTIAASPTPTTLVRHKNFIFELDKCGLEGETVTCHFIVTNTGEDQELETHYAKYSLFYDNFGNEYKGSRIKIANKVDNGTLIDAYFISQVPTKGQISFEQIPDQVTSVALLKMKWVYPQEGEFDIEFRNIFLSR